MSPLFQHPLSYKPERFKKKRWFVLKTLETKKMNKTYVFVKASPQPVESDAMALELD